VNKSRATTVSLLLLATAAFVDRGAAQQAPTPTLDPAAFARVGTVDERFQSYNVEMVEVTGGRFWRHYGPELDALLQQPPAAPAGSGTPAGLNPGLFEQRAPIDLADARLRTLAAGLGPAYVRVSGTWANSTWLADSATPPDAPPKGYNAVLTRQQWKGVVDFARAVDGRLVTSFATSAGARDESGAWTPASARAFVEYTKSLGGSLAAAEFMNEPNLAAMGGAPAGYDAAAYGRDFKLFRAFAREAAPGMLILGPGSVGEGGLMSGGRIVGLSSRDLLSAAGPGVDAFSYHHYGAVSKRCARLGASGTTPEDALSEQWLARTDATFGFYKSLRDELEPGRPIWLTETADAACGGNPWGASFLDSFRYLDQLGRLAKQGVQVVAHNTLAASAYGLVDDRTLAPRPNYWAALLWRTLMDKTVLDSGLPSKAGLHTYAHCLKGTRGGVAILVLNTDKAVSQRLRIPTATSRYTLSSSDPLNASVRLNGSELTWDQKGDLPRLAGASTAAGDVTFAPATISFLAAPGAANGACR
jgi:hypothetical protein